MFKCECGFKLKFAPRLPFRCTCGRVHGSKTAPKPSIRLSRRPVWISTLIVRYRREDDKGLGDTVEHLLAQYGAERIVAMLKRLGLQSCGCQDRKAWLNRRYPYSK